MRAAATVLLLLSGALGLASFAVSVATLTGAVQPLVVVSESMRPNYEVGDLLVAVRVPCHDLHVGQVVTVSDPRDPDALVTHRVVAIRSIGSQRWVSLKGDDNDVADPLTYRIDRDGEVLAPVLRIPLLGALLNGVRSAWVAVPLVVSLGACVPCVGHRGSGRRGFPSAPAG